MDPFTLNRHIPHDTAGVLAHCLSTRRSVSSTSPQTKKGFHEGFATYLWCQPAEGGRSSPPTPRLALTSLVLGLVAVLALCCSPPAARCLAPSSCAARVFLLEKKFSYGAAGGKVRGATLSPTSAKRDISSPCSVRGRALTTPPGAGLTGEAC